MKRLLFFLILFWPSFSFAEELRLIWLEADKENEIRLAWPGEQDWSLKFEHRVLCSGKTGVIPNSQAGNLRVLKIKTPSLNPETQLYATLFAGDTPYAKAVIASSEPFADKKNWFDRHAIALYDPEKDTAEILEEEEIPFASLGSFSDIESFENGVIVVGQGTDFEKESGLAGLLFEKAAKGASILVLSPKGDIPLDYDHSICSLQLSSSPEYLFPFAAESTGETGWTLEARADRLILAEKIIRPSGVGENSKAFGLGPRILDVRFPDPKTSDRFAKPSGRIVFEKDLRLTRWNADIVTKYYFKSLIETLGKEGEIR